MPTESVNESLTAERYRVFSQIDAQDLSKSYSSLATSIADDAEILSLVDSLPPAKRQAGFLFSAARFFEVPFDDFGSFRRGLLDRWNDIEQLARERTLQTNDPARMLAILPILAQIDGPIALIEVGASAGLCLNLDRYSYHYDHEQWIHPADGPSSVRLVAEISGPVPVPSRMPRIGWRAGIELSPLDVDDAEDERWLTALLWPDSDARRANLQAAIGILREHPVPIVEGDLNDQIRSVARLAPADMTLVVMHSAVLPYVEQGEAERFVETVRELGAVWISNELADVVPGVSDAVPESAAFSFVVAVDGEPVAHSHPHGAWVRWHDDTARSNVGPAS